MAPGLGDFLGGADTAAPALVLLVAFLAFAACLLSLFFGTQGKGLVQLGQRGARGTTAFLKFRDALVCCLELLLQGHDEVNQPIEVDASLTHILLELFAGIHAVKLPNRSSRSCASFQKSSCDAYGRELTATLKQQAPKWAPVEVKPPAS